MFFFGPVSFEIVGPTGLGQWRQKLNNIMEASYIANVMEQACIYLQKTLDYMYNVIVILYTLFVRIE